MTPFLRVKQVNRARFKPDSPGFTLLEVMVSIGILALIMTLVWSVSSTSMRGKKRVDARSQIYHEGTVALRKISDDLSMAFLAKKSPQTAAATGQQTGQPQPAESPPAQSGEAELKTGFKTFFIGDDRAAKDSLRFTALSHLRLFKNARESDQCKVSYEIAEAGGEKSGFWLVRREEPFLDQSTDVKTDALVLATDVDEFNIEYYDPRNNEWRKEWDTEQADWSGKLPQAVRITLSFDDPENEKEKIELSTAVTLPMARGPIEY